MHKKYIYIICLILTTASEKAAAQCSGGTTGGPISVTTSWQVLSVAARRYYVFTAISGQAYQFSFCQGGGNASWDTQITLLVDANGVFAGGVQ